MTRSAPPFAALLLLVLASGALAQSPSSSADVRVTWQPRSYSVLPVIEGEVQNDAAQYSVASTASFR